LSNKYYAWQNDV